MGYFYRILLGTTEPGNRDWAMEQEYRHDWHGMYAATLGYFFCLYIPAASLC
jgi:hypothetical protein